MHAQNSFIIHNVGYRSHFWNVERITSQAAHNLGKTAIWSSLYSILLLICALSWQQRGGNRNKQQSFSLTSNMSMFARKHCTVVLKWCVNTMLRAPAIRPQNTQDNLRSCSLKQTNIMSNILWLNTPLWQPGKACWITSIKDLAQRRPE